MEKEAKAFRDMLKQRLGKFGLRIARDKRGTSPVLKGSILEEPNDRIGQVRFCEEC